MFLSKTRKNLEKKGLTKLLKLTILKKLYFSHENQ